MARVCALCDAGDREPLEYCSPDPPPDATQHPEGLDHVTGRELILRSLDGPSADDPPTPAGLLCSVCRLAAGQWETYIWEPDPRLCATLGLPDQYVAQQQGLNDARFHPLLVVCAMRGSVYDDAKWDA